MKQGLWGAFEVFVGTMCICTVTSLVIVVTGLWDSGLDGAPLTLAAFETVLGPVGTIIITVAIFLFALSTTTGWWAYFEVLLRHLCGTNEKLKRTLINVFKVIYPFPGSCSASGCGGKRYFWCGYLGNRQFDNGNTCLCKPDCHCHTERKVLPIA